MRILGIDIGERRIGLALADPEGSYALPAGFLQVSSPAQAAQALADFIEEAGVNEAVVGLPLNMDGSEGPSVRKARALLKLLKPLLKREVKFQFLDERLTSVEASSLLHEAGLKHTKKGKKGRVDAVAASLILQSYLDTRVTARNTIKRAGLVF
jgi:putative Holliday junction resolvase